MENTYQEVKKIFDSKVSGKILHGIGMVIVILIIFTAGMVVGFQKATFGRSWGEHYNENFGMGGRGGMMGNFDPRMMERFPNAHGATGKIIKIELPNIIIQDKDGLEKSVLIKEDTKIEKARIELVASDLKVDDFVVVIGAPNEQGMVMAKLIRVVPSPVSIIQ